jgi:hypothetical protein
MMLLWIVAEYKERCNIMSIKTYKFRYNGVITNSISRIIDNYFLNAKNYIREVTKNPSFEFPKYYRVSAIYSIIKDSPEEDTYNWEIEYKKFVPPSELYDFFYDKTENSLTFERYTYNKRDIPLGNPETQWKLETQLTDKLGLEEFHAFEYKFIVKKYISESSSMLLEKGTKWRCDLTVRYSDDDFLAGDKPGKKIYLVNLNFGHMRSFRKNKNRRKYRNRY